MKIAELIDQHRQVLSRSSVQEKKQALSVIEKYSSFSRVRHIVAHYSRGVLSFSRFVLKGRVIHDSIQVHPW